MCPELAHSTLWEQTLSRPLVLLVVDVELANSEQRTCLLAELFALVCERAQAAVNCSLLRTAQNEHSQPQSERAEPTNLQVHLAKGCTPPATPRLRWALLQPPARARHFKTTCT